MTKEWEIHYEVVYEQEKEIEAGDVIETYIFDPETYERVYVKAIISKDSAKLPDGEKLWVRNFKGHLESEPWAIKILEKQAPPWATE